MLAGTRAFACESSQELLAYQLTYTSPSRLVWKDRNGKELETIGKRTREKLKNTAAALHVILRSRKVDKDAAHHPRLQKKLNADSNFESRIPPYIPGTGRQDKKGYANEE